MRSATAQTAPATAMTPPQASTVTSSICRSLIDADRPIRNRHIAPTTFRVTEIAWRFSLRLITAVQRQTYHMKLDLSISPLSMRMSSPVMERFTAVRYQARSAISSGSAHFPSRVSARTAA